jgi:UDP-N-acetylmuramate-alanine ligase
MSDRKLSIVTFEGKVKIILAGIGGIDSTAGMMMHVFNFYGLAFEFKPDNSGSDEYVSDIAVLSGTSQDGNEISDIEAVASRLKIIAANISDGGTLVFNFDDEVARQIATESRVDIIKIPFKMHGYFQNKLGIYAATHNRTIHVTFTGDENMSSLSAAREACMASGVSEDDFYAAMKSFVGTFP